MAIHVNIKFLQDGKAAHNSQILTGYKLLEKQGLLKIQYDNHFNFCQQKLYEHNSIVEVEVDGKILAYDTADGYQSIMRKDVFDQQLDRVYLYFKRSYAPEFHIGTNSESKVKPLGLNYHCTCKGNPFDRFELLGNPLLDARRFISYMHGDRKWRHLINYRNFESNNHYEKYNILFLTRLWDTSNINKENLKRAYSYLSENEAAILAENMIESFHNINNTRIAILRKLRDEFPTGGWTGGVEYSDIARKECPEFIVDSTITDKANFMKMLKENYICIASTGLHNSIGWKTAEYVTNGRAFLTEPLKYKVPGGFSAGNNYIEYTSADECIEECIALINHVEKIHMIESNNAEYYKKFLSPDQLILRTLEVSGIL